MTGRNFRLIPLGPATPWPDWQITGTVARRAPILSISYELRGPIADLELSPPAAAPARRQGLWQETCFEFFLGVASAPSYWEFNLSPAGHWNVYRFASYRRAMEEETAFDSLPFSLQSRPDAVLLHLEVDLAGMILSDQVLEVGISAILKAKNGEMTYWALTHPGPQPDFHRRDSFSLVL